jgi:hypothetical protein
MRSTTGISLLIVSWMAISGIAACKIVINEVELHPGCDHDAVDETHFCDQWFELYNAGDDLVNLRGWTISSTNSGATIDMTDSGIAPGSTYSIKVGRRFQETDESLILRDGLGIEIDRTPILSDNSGDDYTWSRIPDGGNEWRFVEGTWYRINAPQYSQNIR